MDPRTETPGQAAARLEMRRQLLLSLNRAALGGRLYHYGSWWHIFGQIVGMTGLTGGLLDAELARWSRETGVELVPIEDTKLMSTQSPRMAAAVLLGVVGIIECLLLTLGFVTWGESVGLLIEAAAILSLFWWLWTGGWLWRAGALPRAPAEEGADDGTR